VIRFLIAGATTTLVTLGLYVVILSYMPYAVAYSVAFAVGIGISYLLNSAFVFRTTASARTLALFPLIYVVQYVVGLAVVAIWVDLLGLPDTLAPLAAVAITLPITYLLTRLLFSWRRTVPEQRP
jgi:putative flippase GtrA